MLRKRLISVVSALIVLGVAACGGGGSTGPVVTFPATGSGQATPGTNGAGGAITLTLAPVGGTTGSAAVVGVGSFTASASQTSPTSAALDATGKRSAQAGTGSTPILYVTVTAVNGAGTLDSVTNMSVNTGSTPAAGNYYLAYWNGTEWVTLNATPGTISGNVVTVKGATLPAGQQSIAQGSSDYFVVYNGVVVPPTPTPSPSPTPSPTPVATPTPNAITNGTFASDSLTGWTPCSYAHTPFAAPVNPSPEPEATASQPPVSSGSPSPVLNSSQLTSPVVYVQATSAPANYNPTYDTATPNPPAGVGPYAAQTGSLAAQVNAATGICQTVSVPATGGLLSFWVYEGGTAYNFYNGDQEADIFSGGLTGDAPTATTPTATLFSELNCYYDSVNLGEPAYASSGCFPSAYGGTSAYSDWQGGYWTKRGPYNMSAYAGDQITLFLGVWTDQSHQSYPTSYANYMFISNVSLVP